MDFDYWAELLVHIAIAHYKAEVAENTKKLFKKERSSTAQCYDNLKNPNQKPKYFLEKAIHLILWNFEATTSQARIKTYSL